MRFAFCCRRVKEAWILKRRGGSVKEDSGLEGRLEGSVKLEISVNLEGRLAGRLST